MADAGPAAATAGLSTEIMQQVLSGKSIKFTDLMTMQYGWTEAEESGAPVAKASAAPADFDDIIRISKRSRNQDPNQERQRRARHADLPEELQGHMGEANKAYVNQEYDEAIRLCQHVLTQYPYAPEPYTTLAMVHQDRGDIRTALEFRKLEAVCLSKSGVDWETLGRMSLEVGNMQEATHFFTEASKQAPDNVGIAYELGKLHQRSGNLKKALEYFATALSTNPSAVEIWQRMCGIALSSDGQVYIESVIKHFQTAFARVSVVKKAYVLALVTLLLKADKSKDAMTLLHTHMELCRNPDAEAFADPSKQVRTMMDVVVPPDLDSNIRLQLGLCHTQVPEGRKYAATILEAFRGLKESALSTHVKVVDGFLRSGLYENGLDHCTFLLAHESFAKPFLKLKKAKCLLGLERFAESIQVLLDFLEVMTDHEEAIQTLAIAYEKIGDTESAFSWRRKIDPKTARPRKRPQTEPPSGARSSQRSRTSASSTTSKTSGAAGPADDSMSVDNSDGEDAAESEPEYAVAGEDDDDDAMEQDEAPGDQSKESGSSAAPSSGRSGTSASAKRAKPPSAQLRKANIRRDYDIVFETLSAGDEAKALDLGWKLVTCLLLPAGIVTKKKTNGQEEQGPVSLFADVQSLSSWSDVALKYRNRSPYVVYSRTLDGQDEHFDPRILSLPEWMRLIYQVIRILCTRQKFDDVVAILRRLQSKEKHNYVQSLGFTLSETEKDIIMWLLACAYTELGSLEDASSVIRQLMKRRPKSLRVWNKYHDIHENFGKAANMHRVVVRLLNRVESGVCPAGYLIAGNHHLMTNTFSWATGCYFQAHQMAPEDPVALLCLSVSYVRMVMQRKKIDRHLICVLALTYIFRYFHLRGGEASSEACYNVARAYHHLQLVGLAQSFYEKALAAPGDAFKFEAAHNLGLIYQESGSPELAARLVRRYCVV